MTVLSDDTVTLECRAGHQWTIPRPRRGKWPEYCSDHKRFFLEQLSGRIKPSTSTYTEWYEQGAKLNDPDYVDRWERIWIKTVRLIGARGMSWNAVDVGRVERYIRTLRIAEMHLLYAQAQPYVTSAHGRVQPHPGFELAKETEKDAQRIAVELGLREPDDGLEVKPRAERREAADAWNTRLQAEAEDLGQVDEAAGPDGEPL